MIKDTEFYNKESSVYSEKRYPKVAVSYTQFFFKERLRLTMNALTSFINGKKDLSLLEIGCADGIVVKDIHEAYGTHFASITATDISPGMILSAKEKFGSTGIIFKERKEYTDTVLHDIIIEIGVINYAVLQEELNYIADHIKRDGRAIISLAAQGSVWDRRRTADTGFNNFFTNEEYRKEITQKFNIVQEMHVGLLVPLIWRYPSFARLVMPTIEFVMRGIAPQLFHETIYVLKLDPGSWK